MTKADDVPSSGEPGQAPSSGPLVEHGDLSSAARVQYARRLTKGHGLASLGRLTELAAQLVGATSAQVSVISDEQTVASGVGAAAAAVGGDSPAADSLCTVTVASAQPLRVTDAEHDDRVAHLPPVRSGMVSSYLGVPLVAAGHVIGALCVFDSSPREWSDADVALLQVLASPIVTELELAALEAEYADDRVVWQLAMDAGGVGAFDWNLTTGDLRFDERLLEMFGLEESTFSGTIEAFLAIVHPDDRERVNAALAAAIEACGAYAAEYRLVRPDGSTRWISARGRALAGSDGPAVRVLGAASDTTARQDEEARVARLLESMATAFFHLDRQWRFTYANAEAKRLLGDVSANLAGRVVWELFPEARGSEFERRYRHAMTSGAAETFEAYYPPPLDAWYEVRALPSPDGLSVYFLDVTERRAAQEVLERSNRRAALLVEVTEALTGTLDAEEGVARLAQLMVPELGDWCLVSLRDGDAPTVGAGWRRGLRDVGWWHVDPGSRDLLQRYSQSRIPALSDHSFVSEALREGRPIVVRERAAEAIAGVLETEDARQLCRRLDPWSAVYVSLRGRGRIVGQLNIFRGPDRPPFSTEEVNLLEEVAGRAGLAVDNARLYAEQRDLAEELQRSMMTDPPEPDHLQVAVRYTPAAQAAQVGGDWYDAFLQPEGATVLVIGDVVGHNTASAAAMGQIRSILRGIAVTTGAGPAEVLRRVDHALVTLQMETTATVVVARLEQTPQERRDGLTRLRWSNAGHPPPMLVAHPDPQVVPASTEVLWGTAPNLLLGLHPEAERDETELTVRRGSTVLLYTDGLVERRGQSLDEGLQHLTEVFTDLVNAGLGLEDLCDELLRRMLPERPDDDVALVAVRLHPEDRPRPVEAGPNRVPRTVQAFDQR